MFVFAVILFVFCGVTFAQNSNVDRDWWITNGIVYDIQRGDTGVYIGGSFTYVGPNTGYGFAIDHVGDPIPPYCRIAGNVLSAISDGAGGWYVGGEFSQVGGQSRSKLIRILADGSLDNNFLPEPNFNVRSLLLVDDELYVGGDFTFIGGVARNYIAAINPITGAAYAWNPNANNSVYGLDISPDKTLVYVGGTFTAIGGANP